MERHSEILSSDVSYYQKTALLWVASMKNNLDSPCSLPGRSVKLSTSTSDTEMERSECFKIDFAGRTNRMWQTGCGNGEIGSTGTGALSFGLNHGASSWEMTLLQMFILGVVEKTAMRATTVNI